MAGKHGMRHNNKETKLLAVQMYLELGKSQAQIAQELGLPRRSWLSNGYIDIVAKGKSASVSRLADRENPHSLNKLILLDQQWKMRC
jgi:transposase-like protein